MTIVTTLCVLVAVETLQSGRQHCQEDLLWLNCFCHTIFISIDFNTLEYLCGMRCRSPGSPACHFSVQQSPVLSDLHLQPGLDVQQHLEFVSLTLQVSPEISQLFLHAGDLYLIIRHGGVTALSQRGYLPLMLSVTERKGNEFNAYGMDTSCDFRWTARNVNAIFFNYFCNFLCVALSLHSKVIWKLMHVSNEVFLTQQNSFLHWGTFSFSSIPPCSTRSGAQSAELAAQSLCGGALQGVRAGHQCEHQSKIQEWQDRTVRSWII